MTHITIYISFKFNNERCCCDYREMQLACAVVMMRDFFDFPARDRQGFLKSLYRPLSKFPIIMANSACYMITHRLSHTHRFWSRAAEQFADASLMGLVGD